MDRAAMEREVGAVFRERLARFLRARRWFAGKARTIAATELEDLAWLPEARPASALALARVEYTSGDHERYALLLALGAADAPGAIDVAGCGGDGRGVREAAESPDALRAVIAGFVAAAEGRPPALRTCNGAAMRWGDVPPGTISTGDVATMRPLAAEQSNSSIRVGDRLMLKLFRRIADGENPELEMSRFLGAAGFRATPALRGSISYEAAGVVRTLAVLQEWRDNRGDGWTYVVSALRAAVARSAPSARRASVAETASALATAVRDLGRTTAELHAALASDVATPAFAPEPLTEGDVASWTDALATRFDRVRRRLDDTRASLPSSTRVLVDALADPRPHTGGFAPPSGAGARLARIRIHGDYHLGQTLRTDAGFVVIDFEGEPARPLAERRAKHCAVKDVAGMLRSLDYAVETAAAPRVFETTLRAAFLDGYFTRAGDAMFLPRARSARQEWIDFFELEKALYEVEYELDQRPDWLHIPLRGVRRLLERQHRR